MLYAVIAALITLALLVAWPLLRRENVLEEVDRFRLVRSLTTSWADEPSSDEPEPAE